MNSPTDPRAGHRTVIPVVLGAVLVATMLTGGGAVAVLSGDERTVQAASASASVPVPDPVLTASGPSGPRAAASWDAPLELRVSDGTLKDVMVLDPDGELLDGDLADPTTWRSSEQSLLPAATYRVTASVADATGVPRPMTLRVQTTSAARLLHAVVSPGDGAVVGVGQPVIVRLDRALMSPADRAKVVARLKVVSDPPVDGAWRWMTGDELHFRGPTYWAAKSRIRVSADFRRLQLSGGTWGSGLRSTAYSTGDAVVSTVDVTGFSMTVRRNGAVLRVLKVSTGRADFPSKGGVHLVLEKNRIKQMDSATVGIPRNSPEGYFLKVPFSVRISYAGAFVHSANWSVRDQGVRNVSHGCVNMSPADAEWFYGLVRRGDVVEVVNSKVKPRLSDPGTSDWNIPFSDWAN